MGASGHPGAPSESINQKRKGADMATTSFRLVMTDDDDEEISTWEFRADDLKGTVLGCGVLGDEVLDEIARYFSREQK